MSFQPVVPLSGYVGWRFLERTMESQKATYAASQPVANATDYFRENIGDIRSAADLVDNRRLLSVALGAFGLDDDIDNKFFIRKVLEDGTSSNDALANRIADSRYAEFSRRFGFGDLPFPLTGLTSFADDIIERFEDQQFASAVGDQNNDLRLAMNIDTGIGDILENNATEAGQWFSIMGNAPLREVFQTAFSLPDSIVSIDLDKQREIFQERARSILGSDQLSDISKPEYQEKLTRLFLIRSEAAALTAASGASTALTLLQSTAGINY